MKTLISLFTLFATLHFAGNAQAQVNFRGQVYGAYNFYASLQGNSCSIENFNRNQQQATFKIKVTSPEGLILFGGDRVLSLESSKNIINSYQLVSGPIETQDGGSESEVQSLRAQNDGSLLFTVTYSKLNRSIFGGYKAGFNCSVK